MRKLGTNPWTTPEHVFEGKSSPSAGVCYKDIIMDHVEADHLADYHGVYFDLEPLLYRW